MANDPKLPQNKLVLQEYVCRAIGLFPGNPVTYDMGWAWLVVERMRGLGSSVILNWGEEPPVWEVSWITSGKRYTGVSQEAAMAVCIAFWRGLEAVEDRE